jgi:hypothetical protein
MAVAGRYMPQRYVIGPGLFPIYSVVIKSLIFYFLLPWLLLWLGLTIFSSDFRAAQAGGKIFSTLEPWWLACTYSLFFNTLAFALLDRSQVRSQVVNDWNPRKLPAPRDPSQISRCATISEITFSVATLACWMQLGGYERVFHVFGAAIRFSHNWPYLIWALIAVSGLAIAVACLNLAQGRWTRAGTCLRLGVGLYSWGLVFWILRANVLQSISAGDLSSSDAAEFVRSIKSWAATSAIGVLLMGLIVIAFDLRRIVRVGGESFIECATTMTR